MRGKGASLLSKRVTFEHAGKEFRKICLLLQFIWERYPELYDSVFSETPEIPQSAQGDLASVKRRQIIEALPRLTLAGVDILTLLVEIIESGNPFGVMTPPPIEIIVRCGHRKRWWMFWKSF